MSVQPSEDALVLRVANFVHVGLLGKNDEALAGEAGLTTRSVLATGTELGLKGLDALLAMFEHGVDLLVVECSVSTTAAVAFSGHAVRPAAVLLGYHTVLRDVLVTLLFNKSIDESLLLLEFVVLLCYGIELIDIEGRRDVDNVLRLNLVLFLEVVLDLLNHTLMRVIVEAHVLTHDGEVRVRVRLQVQRNRHLEEAATHPDEHKQVDEDSETEEAADPLELVHAVVGDVVADSNLGGRVVDPNTDGEDVEELVARIRIPVLLFQAKRGVALVPEENHRDEVGQRQPKHRDDDLSIELEEEREASGAELTELDVRSAAAKLLALFRHRHLAAEAERRFVAGLHTTFVHAIQYILSGLR